MATAEQGARLEAVQRGCEHEMQALGRELTEEERRLWAKLRGAGCAGATAKLCSSGVEAVVFPTSREFRKVHKLRLLSNRRLRCLSSSIGLQERLVSLNVTNSEHLAHLPTALKYVKTLRYLFIGGCAFQSLPPVVISLTGLHILDAQRNRITELPPDITKLTALHSLSLADNPLGSLASVSLRCMTSLARLDLGGCHLSSVPDELFTLPCLRHVVLERNRHLAALPETVSCMWRRASSHKSVTRLWDSTSITRLPSLSQVFLKKLIIKQIASLELNQSLAHMPLTHIHITGCQLVGLEHSVMPSTIVSAGFTGTNCGEASFEPLLASAETLTTLDLSSNALLAVPSSFSSFGALRTLHLTTNVDLSTFSVEAARGMTSLVCLNVMNCLIQDMTPLCLLTSLTELDASHNRVTFVPSEVGLLQSLQRLDLSYNRVHVFARELASLPHLRRLSLLNNPGTRQLLGDGVHGVLFHQVPDVLASVFRRRIGKMAKRASC